VDKLRKLALPALLWLAASAGCGPEETCPTGYTEKDGRCHLDATAGRGSGTVPLQCSARILLNEVLYDPYGNEGLGRAFIELSGPPGTPLDGWTIERIAAGGKADPSGLIALRGAIGPRGYFVIGESARLQGGHVPDLVDPRADGKGTAYGLRLLCAAQAVDAMAYGQPDGPSPGEGVSAPFAPEGQSLSRCPDGADTNDNATDFRATEISPGGPNLGCGASSGGCSPDARPPRPGDLVLNELSPAPLSNGGTSHAEFIELVNVGRGAVDLSGHAVAWNPGDSQAFNHRHVLPQGTCLVRDGALVLWGDAEAPRRAVHGVVWIARGSQLQLRNTEGAAHLLGPSGQSLASLCYGSGPGCGRPTSRASMTLDPDLAEGTVPIRHDDGLLARGNIASPGTCQDGSPFSTRCSGDGPGPDPVEGEGEPPPREGEGEPPPVEGEGEPPPVEGEGERPDDRECDERIPEGLLINEIGFHPSEDTDMDGSIDANRDEFVEIVNNSFAPEPMRGWKLRDDSEVRVEFDDAVFLGPGEALLVLGTSQRDCPTPERFRVPVTHLCVGSLGLNNDGDVVSLISPDRRIADRVRYDRVGSDCVEATRRGESLTRNPDLGGRFQPHSQVNARFKQTPGTRTDGTAF
jgi:hypothetical protein